MVQAERQQQTLQSSVNERCQDWRCGGRIRDPHTKRVDSGLYNRPYQGQDQGNDHGPGNADHRHKPFAIKECQGIRQLPEIVVTVIDHASGKTGNDSHEHPHVQRRSPQHGSEVSVYQDFLAKQRVGNRIRITEHSGGHPENGTGDLVDQDKGNDCREGTACPFLCPGAANRNRKQNVQVIDHGPADVLHRASHRHQHGEICSRHLNQLSKADHEACCRHNCNDGH